MLSFVVTSFWVLALISKVKSVQIYNNLSLILVNETTSQCYFNNSKSNYSQIHLCLNDDYNYECSNNLTNGNSSLDCKLQSHNNKCHNTFVNYNGDNITLDCFYKHLNTTEIGDQLNLKHVNECMYGIARANHNNTLLVCGIFHPLITVTTFNSTQIFTQSARYYKFPLFGFEVNKRMVKKYGIIILIAIIVISCLVALCCYGMCHLCCFHMHKNKNNNSNNNTNQRMPQSANSSNV